MARFRNVVSGGAPEPRPKRTPIAHLSVGRITAATMTVALFAQLGEGATGANSRFTVAEVAYDLTADTVIGARRSGMLCTPAGKLRWNDVSPDRRKMTDRLSAAMHADGIDARISSEDDFDREVRTPFRIMVTVERAKIKACVPWMGLKVGKTARQRVTGEIATTWRVFDQKRRLLVLKAAFCTRFKEESDSGDAVANVFLKLAPIVARRIAAAEPLEAREDRAGDGSTPACEENAV